MFIYLWRVITDLDTHKSISPRIHAYYIVFYFVEVISADFDNADD